MTNIAVRTHTLGLGEWAISAEPDDVLLCLGLGSCVAFIAYDATVRLGGMAHMVLPDSAMGRLSPAAPAKFVDIAVPLVVEAMRLRGAQAHRLRVSLVGGARMIQGIVRNDAMNIGERNTLAAQAAVRALGLRVHAEETGGIHGRTVRLSVADGDVAISSMGFAAAGRGGPGGI